MIADYHFDGNAGQVLRQYVYSDNNIRLAMKMNGKTLYYHYNAHGDVVALTDENGKVVAEYAYDAWGVVLKNTATTIESRANPYLYVGYTYEKEIEQYYLMARYYEPEQGVFTAYDPDPGDEDDPQTMNGYNYANNSPVMYVDPDGNFAFVIPVVYWGYGAAIAAAPAVGYGIGKGSKWAWKKTRKFRKQYKTLWKYRKPIVKATNRTLKKRWGRTASRSSLGTVYGIPSSLRKGNGDYVDVGKFNRKLKGKVGYKAKNGWTIEKDHDGHKGSSWKVKDKNGKRKASIKSNGKIVGK
ncbi:RHS repeat domain-containing protein [Listeria fleischmannii]|nr:RHS repeat-associated core domain-containing protein [Listeria fleischmannii]